MVKVRKIDKRYALLDHAEELLAYGKISLVAAALDHILDPKQMAAEEQARFNYLTLLVALYGFGDQGQTRKLNSSLEGGLWSLMRYQLALRQREFATATRIRKRGMTHKRNLSDFRCSLGLHLIWNHRYSWGFKFYQDRPLAKSFSGVVPSLLQYHPLGCQSARKADPLSARNIDPLDRRRSGPEPTELIML